MKRWLTLGAFGLLFAIITAANIMILMFLSKWIFHWTNAGITKLMHL